MRDKKTPWMADDEHNVRFYSKLAVVHGENARALNWGSADSQRLRFPVLAGIGNLSGARILDVGCGFGDFYSWLAGAGHDVDYTGIDLTPGMIERARHRTPAGRFMVANVMDDKKLQAEKYDYVFASGIFYLRKTDPDKYMQHMIKLMFKMCTKGIAFNSLSAWTKHRKPKEFHADPATILEYCGQLTSRVVLRHDYHPGDFAVYMYKKDAAA